MVAKVRGSGERFWSTLGSGLAHTASHSAVWIDFAPAVAGESATATTNSIRSLRISHLRSRRPYDSARSRRAAYLGPSGQPTKTRALDPVMDAAALPPRRRPH